MERAIKAWLIEQGVEHDSIPQRLDLTYTIYGRMLLLPSRAFEKSAWQDLRQHLGVVNFEKLYEQISKYMKVTHIAINQPIPACHCDGRGENIMRSPSDFVPLYGDFGPTTCSSPPAQKDFDDAFWVTAKQNGISQVWAPRWTMFSRGNVSEKARLLTLPSVQQAIEQGRNDGRGSAAVDLYAGIGYFVFSYLKAGVDKVLCWDINPWSIEGLKRGAAANKWQVTFGNTYGVSMEEPMGSPMRLVVFNESNENASDRIMQMRKSLPPIRHVNCGLLPTSRDSWGVALRVLDPELGGWIHVHENLLVKEIDLKAEEVRVAFLDLMGVQAKRDVGLASINRVKSYAPGIMHCVLDIHIGPLKPD